MPEKIDLPQGGSLVVWHAADRTSPPLPALVVGVNSGRGTLDLVIARPGATSLLPVDDVRRVGATPPARRWVDGPNAGNKEAKYGPGAWDFGPQHREIEVLKAQVRQLLELIQGNALVGALPAST